MSAIVAYGEDFTREPEHADVSLSVCLKGLAWRVRLVRSGSPSIETWHPSQSEADAQFDTYRDAEMRSRGRA